MAKQENQAEDKAEKKAASKAEKSAGKKVDKKAETKGEKTAAPKGPATEPRLRAKYRTVVAPALQEKFGIKNVMALPRLNKITLNMGFGQASKNKSLAEALAKDLTEIAGQKALINKSRSAVATWKLREGDPVGAKVTLRGWRMWLFLEKLISVAVPRIRDFQGLNPRSFDGRGNYNMGLDEQTIFPDIELDKVKEVQGMDIAFSISGGNDEWSRELLLGLGVPLRRAPARAEAA
jgi:large subunit ribosomal protein L5